MGSVTVTVVGVVVVAILVVLSAFFSSSESAIFSSVSAASTGGASDHRTEGDPYTLTDAGSHLARRRGWYLVHPTKERTR